MFDIGWLELIVIGIVALIVVGPNDLPQLFRNVGRFMGRMRAMAREFQRSMEDAANESGLKDATKGLNDIRDIGRGPAKSARSYAKDLMKGDTADKGKGAAGAPATAPGKAAPNAGADAAGEAKTPAATKAAEPEAADRAPAAPDQRHEG